MPLAPPPPHESVEALLSEAYAGEDAAAVIRRKARSIIQEARYLWKGPPYCPLALADIEGIIVREATEDIRSDGRIFHLRDQVYIEYAKGQCRERMRFTVAHELAHTLFPDCFKRERRRSEAEKGERFFEKLCHLGASEFLFPVDDFTGDMGNAPLTAEQLISLAHRYDASIDATAHRMVDLCKFPVSVVFANYRPCAGKATTLSVRYAVSNEVFPFKVHPNYRINTKSVANAAHRDRLPKSAFVENWHIGRGWARLQVEAIPLPEFEAEEASDVAVLLYLPGRTRRTYK